MKITHSDLVQRATNWLKNTFHCRVILTELTAYTRSCETPDVIGWVNNRAILVECKMNKSDFYADLKKISRQTYAPALGHYRFYLSMPNILDPNKIPDNWGLYEVHGKRIFWKSGYKYQNAGIPPFNSDRDSEVAMLISALSRYSKKQHNGMY